MENLKEIESMNEFDLHMPSEVLPIQVKQNKSVIGKISISNFPTGARSNFGQGKNTDFEINIQNSQQMLLSSSVICCDMTLTGSTAGKYVKYQGGQTALKSITISLDNKKLVDLQNNADKVGDFHLRSTSTEEQLSVGYSTLGYSANIQNGETITLRIDLKHFGCDIGNLIPTGTIGSMLRINGTINDNSLTQLSKGDTDTADDNIIPPAGCILTYDNIRLESEFVELQPMLLNKRIEKIKSSSGLTIPFHTYAVDSRTLADVNSFNERIALSYNNVVALYQIPYGQTKTNNYYNTLTWGGNNMNEVGPYYVKFDGGQYYNLNSNAGQKGLASHAQALLNASKSEFTSPGYGSLMILRMNKYQVLATNFVRSNNVLSPSITDSGVNARLQSGIISTECNFLNDLNTNQLITIVKFTRRIVFKNGSMDVFS